MGNSPQVLVPMGATKSSYSAGRVNCLISSKPVREFSQLKYKIS